MTRNQLAALTVVFAFLLVPRAHACSCTEYLSGQEALKKSALVFTGEVVSIKRITLPTVVYTKERDGSFTPTQRMSLRGVITLNVLKQWKGTPAKSYVVLGAPEPDTPLPAGLVIADCDAHLEVGKKYLVFATEGYSEANTCAPTGLLEERAETVRDLDRLAADSQKARR